MNGNSDRKKIVCNVDHREVTGEEYTKCRAGGWSYIPFCELGQNDWVTGNNNSLVENFFHLYSNKIQTVVKCYSQSGPPGKRGDRDESLKWRLPYVRSLQI